MFAAAVRKAKGVVSADVTAALLEAFSFNFAATQENVSDPVPAMSECPAADEPAGPRRPAADDAPRAVDDADVPDATSPVTSEPAEAVLTDNPVAEAGVEQLPVIEDVPAVENVAQTEELPVLEITESEDASALETGGDTVECAEDTETAEIIEDTDVAETGGAETDGTAEASGLTLTGTDGADWLIGGAGDDVIYAGNADAFVSGGDGFDTVHLSDKEGGVIRIGNGLGIEQIFGTNANDVIDAHLSGDRLTAFGNAGDDALSGGSNADVLDGGAGSDTIDGGIGNDTLTGGDGRDLFLFRAEEFGIDTITDFASGTDVISFAGRGLGFDDLVIAAHEAGASVTAGGHTILLAGAAHAALTAEAFIL